MCFLKKKVALPGIQPGQLTKQTNDLPAAGDWKKRCRKGIYFKTHIVRRHGTVELNPAKVTVTK